MSKTNNENLFDFPTDVSVCRLIFFVFPTTITYHVKFLTLEHLRTDASRGNCYLIIIDGVKEKKEASWLERPSSRVLQYIEASHCYHASDADYLLASSCQALPLLAPVAVQCQV